MKIWGDEMSKIYVSCIDQLLKVTSAPTLASGGLNEVSVVFDFCEKWDGYIKTATFYREVDDVYYSVLDENDTCVVPWEVCGEDGSFYFSVFGEKGSTRRTASTVRYKVVKGAITSDFQPSDPTPELYDQILGIVNETKKEQETFVTECQETLQAAETAAELAEQRADDALEIATNAETIAKGRATGYVFDTKADMMTWLSDEANTAKLVVGDNLYIRDKGVHDYWWDGEKEQELETQKVDLTEYVKNTDYVARNKVGLVGLYTNGTFGLTMIQDQNKYPGGIKIQMAEKSAIDARSSQATYQPIVPATLDYAVKTSLSDCKESWSEGEKQAARDLLGIADLITDLQDRVAALENGGSGGGDSSNDVYIDGDYVNWESLGETWADSIGYTVCQDCGFQGYIYGMNGYAVIDKCWDCTGGGTYYLMDESGNNVDYNSPVVGGWYSTGEYAEPYLSFYINGKQVDYGTYYDEPWSDIAHGIMFDCPNCGQGNSLEDIDGYIGMRCMNDHDCSQTYYLTDDSGVHILSSESAVIGGSYYLTTQKPM